jgi:hypothetical protein
MKKNWPKILNLKYLHVKEKKSLKLELTNTKVKEKFHQLQKENSFFIQKQGQEKLKISRTRLDHNFHESKNKSRALKNFISF